jgi:hypothetical protein
LPGSQNESDPGIQKSHKIFGGTVPGTKKKNRPKKMAAKDKPTVLIQNMALQQTPLFVNLLPVPRKMFCKQADS